MSTDTQVKAMPARPAAGDRPVPAGLPKKPALKVVVVEDWAELEQYAGAWDALAAAAVEPNPFYESWMLRPALEHYATAGNLCVVLVVADLPAGAPLLCGVFPLERRRRYKGLPARTLSLWKYVHCYLCTPLVHAAYAGAVLEAFFHWLASDRKGAALLECPWISAEGPFSRLLVEHLEQHRQPTLLDDRFTRALLLPRDSAKSYLEAALSGERRRRLRKHEQRLAEQGSLEYAVLPPDGPVETWLEDFLRLEASGWKGKEGTALQCSETDRHYFLAVMTAAFRRGRLGMLALRLAGQPIALLCDVQAEHGCYVYKLAFDETQAACSPGVLLELERLRWVHDHPETRWVDSCNAPGPALLKDLWADRRVLQTLVVASGRAPGPLVLALVPLLRWLRRKVTGLFGLFRWRREGA